MIGLSSCHRASLRSVKVAQERSSGTSIVSAIRPYSVKASSCLKGFLNKNPLDRLGCRVRPDGQSPFVDIMEHIFFKLIDWDALERRHIDPPFKPKVDEEEDILGNFDPQFTTEPVILTPDDPPMLEKLDQSEFEGFEYINPLLMSSESEPV